jgi:hypothetical protein
MMSQSVLPGFETLREAVCFRCGIECERPIGVPEDGALCEDCFRGVVTDGHDSQQLMESLGLCIAEATWPPGLLTVGLFRTLIAVLELSSVWRSYRNPSPDEDYPF